MSANVNPEVRDEGDNSKDDGSGENGAGGGEGDDAENHEGQQNGGASREDDGDLGNDPLEADDDRIKGRGLEANGEDSHATDRLQYARNEPKKPGRREYEPEEIQEKPKTNELGSSKRLPAAVTERDEKAPLFQTRLRQAVSPYLPPPVVRSIQKVDPHLEPYVGPEATVTVVGSLILAWFVVVAVRFLSSRMTGRGRAIAEEDDDHDVLGKLSSSTLAAAGDDYDATVLLCGPPGAGKTRLFYQLCFGEDRMPTVTSIQANVAVSSNPPALNRGGGGDDGTEGGGNPLLRFMDWPGHASLSDSALERVLREPPRLVLVLDSTQPVAAAAERLYRLLAFLSVQYDQRGGKEAVAVEERPPFAVFVACHKKDLPKSKNWRRIKIQMRTELERLLKLRGHSAESEGAGGTNGSGVNVGVDNRVWWSAGKPLELDELGFCRLHFSSTTCNDREGSPELSLFCKTGALPEGSESNNR